MKGLIIRTYILLDVWLETGPSLKVAFMNFGEATCRKMFRSRGVQIWLVAHPWLFVQGLCAVIAIFGQDKQLLLS